MIYGCLYRYINKIYLSRVLPLRGLVVVVHEVHLAGGGLSLLPARRKGTKHVLAVASSNIKTVLPQVSVWRVEGEVLKYYKYYKILQNISDLRDEILQNIKTKQGMS